MLRKLFKILFIIILLLLVVFFSLYITIRSDLPRSFAVEALSRGLGMKVTVESLKIDWRGDVAIRNLVLTTPVEDEPFIEVPNLDISIRAIPSILFNRTVKLNQIRIENTVINIREYQENRWNVQDFLSALKKDSSGSNSRMKINLPQLELINCKLIIKDFAGQVENIEPVTLRGSSVNKPAWNFELNIASQIAAVGWIAEGGTWMHQVRFNVNNIPESVRRFISIGQDSLNADVVWQGHIEANNLKGNLQVDRLQFGQMQANGTVELELSPVNIGIRFDELFIRGLKNIPDEVRIFGGTVQIDNELLHADSVLLIIADNSARLTGNWNLGKNEGDFSGYITGQTTETDVQYESTFSGSITWPKVGRKQLNISLTTNGQSVWGGWQGDAEISGSGQNWSDSEWQVDIPFLELQMQGNNIISRYITADINVDWPEVRLNSLDLNNADSFKASGEFSTETFNWTIGVESEGLIASDFQKTPIDLNITAQGNKEDVTISNLNITYKDINLEVGGKIEFASKQLSDSNAKITWLVRPPDEVSEGIANVSGDWHSDITISGTIWPIRLHLESMLFGQDVKINQKSVSTLTIPWQADIDSDSVQYKTGQFQLFEGMWDFNGQYRYTKQSTAFTINADKVSLIPIIEMFNIPIQCRGLVTANLDANLPLTDISGLSITGAWNVNDLAIPPVEAERAQGRIFIQNGSAKFDQIRLNNGQGFATADTSFRLSQPELISVEVDAQNWPINIPGQNIVCEVNAQGSAILNLLQRTIESQGNTSTFLFIDNKQIASISAEVKTDTLTLYLSDIQITALDGRADGNAVIPLNNLPGSKMAINWQQIDITQLADYFPALAGLAGISSGTLNIAQSEGKKPLEPMQLRIIGEFLNGKYKNADIGKYSLSGYFGMERLIVEKMELEVLKGTIKASGNLRRNTAGFLSYINTSFSDIELDPLVHLFLPDAQNVAGNLSGRGMLVIFSDLHGMTGEANIELSESDLAQTAVIGTLYNTMKLDFAEKQSTGQGQIKLRFEGSSLEIPSFVYFNRGVEIRGRGRINDITVGSASAVEGYVIGIARPLRGITLLGIDELDKLMSSLQSGVTSVKVQGSVAEPKVEIASFQEISTGLRALFWQQLFRPE